MPNCYGESFPGCKVSISNAYLASCIELLQLETIDNVSLLPKQ